MKTLGKLLASLYSFCFTFLLLVFLVFFFIRGLTTQNFWTNALKEMDFSQIKVKDYGLDDYIKKYGENATIEDVITIELENAGIDTESVNKILNDESIREFVGSKANEIIDAAMNKKEVGEVTETEIKEALNVLNLSEEEYQEVTDFINEVITQFNTEVKDGSSL